MIIFVIVAIALVVVKVAPFFFLWERLGFLRAGFWSLYIEVMIIDTACELFTILVNHIDIKDISILLIILFVSISVVFYYLRSWNMRYIDIFIFLIMHIIILGYNFFFIYHKTTLLALERLVK